MVVWCGCQDLGREKKWQSSHGQLAKTWELKIPMLTLPPTLVGESQGGA